MYSCLWFYFPPYLTSFYFRIFKHMRHIVPHVPFRLLFSCSIQFNSLSTILHSSDVEHDVPLRKLAQEIDQKQSMPTANRVSFVALPVLCCYYVKQSISRKLNNHFAIPTIGSTTSRSVVIDITFFSLGIWCICTLACYLRRGSIIVNFPFPCKQRHLMSYLLSPTTIDRP